MRSFLKKIFVLKLLVVFFRVLKARPGIFKKISLFVAFLASYRKYKKVNKNQNLKFRFEDLYPRIFDNTETTHVDPIYFYQDTWCAKKIFDNNPSQHFDIGSNHELVGIISQFTPTTMIDIRPLQLVLNELSFIKGDILNLPFKDGEINSLSSICVMEHIGLGRYGDPLDSFGTEKAADELSRVLGKEGNLYISVPVDTENIVYFNAHRTFRRDYILNLFSSLKLIEERYIYGDKVFDHYDPQKGFGTGLYYFKK